jgi:hypothetical protein
VDSITVAYCDACSLIQCALRTTDECRAPVRVTDALVSLVSVPAQGVETRRQEVRESDSDIAPSVRRSSAMGRMNGGPNKAIRQAMKKNIMQRAEKMILTGVYATPAWYEALRYIPPYVRGPKNAKDRKVSDCFAACHSNSTSQHNHYLPARMISSESASHSFCCATFLCYIYIYRVSYFLQMLW